MNNFQEITIFLLRKSVFFAKKLFFTNISFLTIVRNGIEYQKKLGSEDSTFLPPFSVYSKFLVILKDFKNTLF